MHIYFYGYQSSLYICMHIYIYICIYIYVHIFVFSNMLVTCVPIHTQLIIYAHRYIPKIIYVCVCEIDLYVLLVDLSRFLIVLCILCPADSFCTVRQGNHIMHRDYAFVRRTPHNRASFIRLFWKCFRRVGQKAGKFMWMMSMFCV